MIKGSSPRTVHHRTASVSAVTQIHPTGHHYRDQIVRLADLAMVSDIIVGQTFENCVLVGPAVVALLGATHFSNNTFDVPDVASALWSVPEGQQVIVGAVGLQDCNIVNCRWQRIGLAVLPGQREIIYQSFGLLEP